MREHIGERLQGQQFVVPGELIGTRNGGARDIVVELMPDDPLPRLGELGAGIAGCPQPVGHHGRTLGGITQVLVLPVVEFHRRLRGVAAIAMHVHRQLAIEDRQFGVLVVGHEVLVDLVACGADHLHRTITMDAFLYRPHRSQGGRTADISGAIVAVGDIERTLLDLIDQVLILRQVGIVVTLRIVESVCHHDAAAIDALPQSDGERIAPSALVEGLGAPHEFLRRETDEATMGGQCGQGVAKAEAVGQEDVGALGIELRAVERLSEQHVPQPRLRRANDGLVGIPTAAGDMPTPLCHVAFHLLVLDGVILLHPGILHRSLEVKDIVGILLEKEKVLGECVTDMVADSGLHVPVPLRVEMRVGHHIGLHFLVLGIHAQGEQSSNHCC